MWNLNHLVFLIPQAVYMSKTWSTGNVLTLSPSHYGVHCGHKTKGGTFSCLNNAFAICGVRKFVSVDCGIGCWLPSYSKWTLLSSLSWAWTQARETLEHHFWYTPVQHGRGIISAPSNQCHFSLSLISSGLIYPLLYFIWFSCQTVNLSQGELCLTDYVLTYDIICF